MPTSAVGASRFKGDGVVAVSLPRGLKFLPEIARHLVPKTIHLGTNESMTSEDGTGGKSAREAVLSN